MGVGQEAGGGVGVRDVGVGVWDEGVEGQARAPWAGGGIGEGCTAVGAGGGPDSEEAGGWV